MQETVVIVGPTCAVPVRVLDEFPDALLNELPTPTQAPLVVAVTSYGFTTASNGKYTEILQECIDRYGDTVVYAPAIFLSDALRWATPHPYDWDASQLEDLRREALEHGHDGLSYVRDAKRFEWPSVESALLARARRTNGAKTFRDLPSSSFLSEAGYSVARNGPSLVRRRLVLLGCIQNEGLEAVARKLAGFVLGNRFNPNMNAALEKWKSDLNWLHVSAYRENCGWQWPYWED